MQIHLHETREWPTPSGAMQQFPAGWSGDVPDAAAAKWISEGVAERIAAPPVAGALTPRQTAILARAADEIEALAGQQGAPVGDDADDDGGEVDLNAMTDDELRLTAESLGIKPGRKSRAKLIEAIEAAVAQTEAAGAAHDAATDGDPA